MPESGPMFSTRREPRSERPSARATLPGDLEHLGEQPTVVGGQVSGIDDVLFRHHEDMRRRNRVQVAEGVDELGGQHLGRGALTGHDGTKQAVGQGRGFLAFAGPHRLRVGSPGVVPQLYQPAREPAGDLVGEQPAPKGQHGPAVLARRQALPASRRRAAHRRLRLAGSYCQLEGFEQAVLGIEALLAATVADRLEAIAAM